MSPFGRFVTAVEESSLLGQTLGGTYRVEEKLGAGGMGEVFRALHLRTGRPYAVKVLLPRVAIHADALERFRREAEAVGALGHANVVAIHDFDTRHDLAYLVMDLLEGEDLAARLGRVGRLPMAQALSIFEGIAAGLGAAHGRSLVHRDLKPANVFLARHPGAPERAVLLDFGLAKSLAPDEGLSGLTATGVVMGTPQYMSPEQASGLPLDARADLYSAATILFEMLAGRPPIVAPTVPSLFAALATQPPPPVERFRPDVPGPLSAVLARALAKAPDDRYGSAAELAAAVRHAAGNVTPVGNAAWPPPSINPMAATQATPSGNGAAEDWTATPVINTMTPSGVRVTPLGTAPTMATPMAAMPTPAAAPLPHPAASTPDAAGRGGVFLLFAFGALVALGTLGVGGGLFLYYHQARQTQEQLASLERSLAPPTPPTAEPVTTSPALTPPTPTDAGSAMTPIEEPTAQAEEPPPRTRRRRRRADHPPSAPTVPSTPPASGPPSTPPRDGAVAAIEYMGRGDYEGCIRETHRHPRSERILSTRMSCASHGNDAELRRTCAELRQHYPNSAYNNGCRGLMLSRGLSP